MYIRAIVMTSEIQQISRGSDAFLKRQEGQRKQFDIVIGMHVTLR